MSGHSCHAPWFHAERVCDANFDGHSHQEPLRTEAEVTASTAAPAVSSVRSAAACPPMAPQCTAVQPVHVLACGQMAPRRRQLG